MEGWAHYVEQMMVDEGFGGGDPAVRLGQLRRALQIDNGNPWTLVGTPFTVTVYALVVVGLGLSLWSRARSGTRVVSDDIREGEPVLETLDRR